jgi:hypothetical protein
VIARVATFDSLPDDIRPDAVDQLRTTVKETAGYVAGFHLRDPRSGKAMSVVVLEDEQAIGRIREALAQRPEQDRVGIEPDHVEFLEAFAF